LLDPPRGGGGGKKSALIMGNLKPCQLNFPIETAANFFSHQQGVCLTTGSERFGPVGSQVGSKGKI
jgi:hypothetical protein